MRTTTKKILLLLHAVDQEKRRIIPVNVLRELLPEITTSGFRSLIHHLSSTERLAQSGIGQDKSVIGTATGDRLIEHQYGWLRRGSSSDRIGSGQLIVFRHPPTSDIRFRRLRKLILADGGIAITRGIYINQSGFSRGIWAEIATRYSVHVAVIEISRFLHGSVAATSPQNGQNELAQSISGISRQVDRLLVGEASWSKLTYQQKVLFASLFDHLVAIFGEYSGLAVGGSLQQVAVVAEMKRVLNAMQQLVSSDE